MHRDAIGPHETEVVDESWDGGEAEGRLKNDEDEDYYREAYAWVEDDAGENKSDYRFIHHEVDGDGNIGPANLTAAQTGIGILNGGRGVNVSEQPWSGDRQGIYDHLAAHIRDAGEEPPDLEELNSREGEIERRHAPLIELRVHEGGDDPDRIIGHAAVFDELSDPIMGFRERVAPGAFSKTIQEADVRALWNHDSNFVLGRTKSNTLSLSEDDRGLQVDIQPPETQWATDLLTSMKRGDVDQMSFGFRTIRDRWDTIDDQDVRTLVEVELFDVSPVTFPAYPQTDAQVRDILSESGIDYDALASAFRRNDYGLSYRDKDIAILQQARDVLDEAIPPAPGQESHPGEQDEEPQERLTTLRRQLRKKKRVV